MNIWLINHYAVPPQYYPLARPTNFAKHLMEMGHTVTIFAASTVHNSVPMKNLISDASSYREETVDGVSYVYINCKNYAGSGIKRIYNMCQFAWKLPGICKKYPKPDAIVATSIPPMSCAMGIHLAHKYKCKGIAEIADLWPESLIDYGMAGPKNPIVIALRLLEKWIYKKAHAVVFTMEGAYDYIKEQKWESAVPPSKVYCINNGVDLDTFNRNKEQFPLEDEDLYNPNLFKVVYTGSIRKVNNLGLLLDAAKQVCNPNVRFLIWGDGDELESLKQRAVQENISNVCFKGRVQKAYVPYIVSKADLNIAHNNPSPLFRFGISFNKLFDYFAAGKPVLSDFPCPYNPAVQMRAGIGVDTPDASSIAQAVEYFVNLSSEDYQEYCRNAAKAAEKYDFRALTQQLMDVIEAV